MAKPRHELGSWQPPPARRTQGRKLRYWLPVDGDDNILAGLHAS
jgi:hypothetical protein